MNPHHTSILFRVASQATLFASLSVAGVAQTDVAGTSGVTEIVSTDEAGLVGPGGSITPAISEDGRYVAFKSSSALLPEDTNFDADIYVKDRVDGSLVCASTTAAGVYGNGVSSQPEISADGRYVVFYTESTNFGPLDSNGLSDVYRKDLMTGALDRASNVNLGASAGNNESLLPSVSDDGRWVAFISLATDLVANDTNGLTDVFVRDMLTGETLRVSNGVFGQSNGSVLEVRISGDGTHVAYTSQASNLVFGDVNGVRDVFLTEIGFLPILVSRTAGGQSGNALSGSPRISSDGSRVCFESNASNLVPFDWNVSADIFCLDVPTMTMERASVDSSQFQQPYSSIDPTISRDGRMVAFSSYGDFAPTNTLGITSNLYVRDLENDRTWAAGRPSGAGSQTQSPASSPALAQGGSVVAFQTLASNIDAVDTNGQTDVFIRTMHPDPFSYCTGSVTSAGCVPTLTATGFSSLSGQTDLAFLGDELPNQKQGILFYGLAGQASVPFAGATLCIAPPLARTPLLQTSGSAPPASDCTGFFAFDMNAFAAGLAGGNPRPELSIVGQTVNVQCWGRDTPATTFLSSAVQYIVGP